MIFRPSRTSASIILAVAALSLPSLAQAFEVKDVVATTLKNNAEVRMKWHNFRATAEERGVVRANYLPVIDLSYSAARENRTTPQSTGGSTSSSFSRNGYNLNLSQNLFQGFITNHQVKQLDFTSRARYYEYLAEAEAQSQEAVRAFIDVVRFGKLVEIAEENFSVHKGIYEQILQRVTQGVGRRVDLEQVSGRMALAESNLINEIANLQDVSTRYARIVGTPAPEQLVLGNLPTLPASSEVMQQAEKYNPRMLAAGALYHAAEADIEARRGVFSPTLDLRANKNGTNNREGVKGQDSRSSVELIMNMNLYRGGADRARLASASARLDEAEALGIKSCRDMRQQVTIAYNDSIKLNSQLDSLRQHLLSTEKARDAYRQQFDIGQRTLLDLLDSENELFQARRDMLGAELDLQLARYRVLGESGRLLESLALKANDGGDLNTDPVRAFNCASAASKPYIAEPAASNALPAFTPTPMVAKTVAPAPNKSIIINTQVQFDLNSANIREDSKPQLDKLASLLQSQEIADKRLLVEGHTDSSGNAAANLKLSQQRADAVRNYLASRGISADRLQSAGRGASSPQQGTQATDPANRRVLVVLQEQAGKTMPSVSNINVPVIPALPKTMPAPVKKVVPAPAPTAIPAVAPAPAIAASPAPAPLPTIASPANSDKATQLRRQLLQMAPSLSSN